MRVHGGGRSGALALSLVVAALVLWAAAPATARAQTPWWQTLTPAQQDNVVDNVRWGGYRYAYPPSAPTGRDAAWRAITYERSASAGGGTSAEQRALWQRMHEQLLAIRQRARQMPSWSRFSTLTFRAIDAWDVGVKVGGAVSKYLKLGVNTAPPGGDLTRLDFTWRNTGDSLSTTSYYDGTLPSPIDGFLIRYHYATGGDYGYWHDGGSACPGWRPTQHVGGPNVITVPHRDRCFVGYDGGQKVYADLNRNVDLVPIPGVVQGPMEPWTGQPYDKFIGADSAPTSTQERQGIQEFLEDDDNEDLRRYYESALDPELVANPFTPKNHDHSCDTSHPTFENRAGNSSPTPHDPYDPADYDALVKPSGAADPYLRWGRATWAGTFVDNWGGWGWRHVKAKHGWEEADETQTREALEDPSPESQSPTSMVYTGPEFSVGDVTCERRVVVEYQVQGGDPPLTPKGIITSYPQQVTP